MSENLTNHTTFSWQFPQARMDLRRLTAVLRLAIAMKRKQLIKSSDSLDDNKLLRDAIMQIVRPTLTESDCLSVAELVDRSFPSAAMLLTEVGDEDTTCLLRSEIKEELNKNKLHATSHLVDKVWRWFARHVV